MNFKFLIILILYSITSMISILLALLPLTFYLYNTSLSTEYFQYFFLPLGIAILWLLGFILFVTLHGRIVTRIFLPSIKEGSFPMLSSQNKIYSLRLSADNIAKYWSKTLEWIPFLSQLFLHKFFLTSYGVKIGKNVYIATEVRIDGLPLIEIGNDVFIGPRAIIGAHINHKGGNILYKKVKIGNNVFIGNNSVVTPGGILGNKSILGAFSVILLNQEIPEGETWIGMPAKPLKKSNNTENGNNSK